MTCVQDLHHVAPFFGKSLQPTAAACCVLDPAMPRPCHFLRRSGRERAQDARA
eukprot:CAMPEP_0117667356 /NCGR_PEP_ID=MMETSP0804-20121206/10916_1 /TAXON_ID=1074897 /ORGANISM="Tetraselmis astigmatica, Strain CCMP880" /LENGTH=52 /DNA_ID=CAMNT_0005475063 /DNA_START=101 /DNA_END=255 /DNA_ORIENTATION=-